MARWISSSLAAAAGAALLAGGVWLARRDEAPSADSPAALSPAPPSATTAHAPATGDEPEPRLEIERADPPALARYREEIAFGNAVRAFFDGYRELAKSERAARAEELLRQIDARERDGRILSQEALVLRLGILRATVDDPAVLDSESRRLVEDYRARAEQAAANRVPDPRDEHYQTRQAEIAREVMALEEIPGGVSREEYLRKRLRELRLEVYANGHPASE